MQNKPQSDNQVSKEQSSPQIKISIRVPKQIKSNQFSIIKAQAPNLLDTDIFIDDQFILKPNHHKQNTLVIKRLSQIHKPKTSLFMNAKTGRNLINPTKNKINIGMPTYLSELNMLPFQHFHQLIQPPYINQKGYYHVVMWKDGMIVKQIIDDTVYYDEKLKVIYGHPLLEDNLWVYIILKAWAKYNKGYQQMQKCIGFQFLKTFSYPDWQYINPSQQKQQNLNSILAKATNRNQFLVCKTKSDPNVGHFGFSTNCASFIIRRHYQEYGDIFLIISPFVHDHWNKLFCNGKNNFPQDMPVLHDNQFIIPIDQFLNIFHLIYITNNKYTHPKKKQKQSPLIRKSHKISYDKYILDIDARDTKAKVLAFQLLDNNAQNNQQLQVGINFYFPSIKIFDLVHQSRHQFHMPGDWVTPWTKIMIGKYLQGGIAEVSFVQSVKQKIFDYKQNQIGFASYNPNYQYVIGQYFQGYSNQVTYNLSLKPGKYYIRLKIQQKQSEYRCHVHATAINSTIKLFDPKITDQQQTVMLKDCLISKAKIQKKFITHINPQNNGSWIICRNQLDSLGYGYIVVQVMKSTHENIKITIDPKKLKEHGYAIKGNKQLQQSTILVDSQQNGIIILKHDKQSESSDRKWPPPGIQFEKVKYEQKHHL